MKKLFGVMIALVIFLSACATVSIDETNTFDISEKRALEIATEYWQVEDGDVDKDTGFLIDIVIIKTPTASLPQYTVALKWLVEGENWSTVDEIKIDATTGECIVP